jgi:hypothetical protein
MSNESEINKAKAHIPKLILTRDIRKSIHGDSLIGRFNTFIAVKITTIVGSMWCAYIFTILTLISLPAAIKTHDPIIIVSWIAQTFLQLVLLPIIIVGQNIQAAASDARALNDHDTLIAIHTLTAEIYKIDEQQNIILDLLENKIKPRESK